MRTRLLLLLLCPIGPLGTTRCELLGGRFSFDAPSDWRQDRRVDRDSTSFVVFEVPPPRSDTSQFAPNVVVEVERRLQHWDLKTYSNAKLAPPASGTTENPIIRLDDRFSKRDHSRTVLSRGRLHGLAYAVWDKFTVRDSICVHLSSVMPAVYRRDSIWYARFSAQLDSLTLSSHVGANHVFSRRTPPTH